MVDAPFLHIGEEGGHRIKIARGERVKLMVVAFGAAER